MLAKALGEMDSDDAADVVDDLEKRQARPGAGRHARDRAGGHRDDAGLRGRDRRAPDAARGGGRARSSGPSARPSTTCAARAEELPELFFDVYVVDPAYKPVGAVPVSHLLRSKRDVPLAPDHGAGDRDPGRHGPGRGRLHLQQVPPDLRPGGRAGRPAGRPDHRRRHRRRHPGRDRGGHPGPGRGLRRRPRRRHRAASCARACPGCCSTWSPRPSR